MENQHVVVNMYLDLAQTARHVFEVSLRKKNEVILLGLFIIKKLIFVCWVDNGDEVVIR
jgi:hypothetical protein